MRYATLEAVDAMLADLMRSYRCGSRSNAGMPSGTWWKGWMSTV